MKIAILTIYVLIWPTLAAMVLGVLGWNVWKDIRDARRNGEELV